MANEFNRAQKLVEASILLLHREIVLPRTVWRQPDAAFAGSEGDTITLDVPAYRTGKSRTMRSATALVAEDLAETKVPVKLDTHAYDLLKVSDEDATLSIKDYTRQILAPQMHAVARQCEDVIGSAIAAAPIPVSGDQQVAFDEGVDDPYKVAVQCRKVLNKLDVPAGNRFILLGADVDAAFLESDKISRFDASGSTDALREAMIGRVAGFTVMWSNAIPADEAYAYHQTAVAFGNVAPRIPRGATNGARGEMHGFAMRYLEDYAPENASGPVDRTLVDAFMGASSVNDDLTDVDGDTEDDDLYNRRLVKIEFTAA